MYQTFFKVIVVSVDILESRIVDERHFKDYTSATAYVEAMKSQEYVAVLVKF